MQALKLCRVEKTYTSSDFSHIPHPQGTVASSTPDSFKKRIIKGGYRNTMPKVAKRWGFNLNSSKLQRSLSVKNLHKKWRWP